MTLLNEIFQHTWKGELMNDVLRRKEKVLIKEGNEDRKGADSLYRTFREAQDSKFDMMEYRIAKTILPSPTLNTGTQSLPQFSWERLNTQKLQVLWRARVRPKARKR